VIAACCNRRNGEDRKQLTPLDGAAHLGAITRDESPRALAQERREVVAAHEDDRSREFCTTPANALRTLTKRARANGEKCTSSPLTISICY
jgi:hypothetical protein